MGDSVVIVISIILAAILMFVFPMLAMSARNDDIAQSAVQSTVAQYVSNICTKGSITLEDHDKLIHEIYATGNTYRVEYEISVSDGNSGKKTTTVNPTKIGEQEQFTIYTSEIMDEMNRNGVYRLKKGDKVALKVMNNNQTLFQTLQSVFYRTTSDSYQICAQSSGTVTADGGMQ